MRKIISFIHSLISLRARMARNVKIADIEDEYVILRKSEIPSTENNTFNMFCRII